MQTWQVVMFHLAKHIFAMIVIFKQHFCKYTENLYVQV